MKTHTLRGQALAMLMQKSGNKLHIVDSCLCWEPSPTHRMIPNNRHDRGKHLAVREPSTGRVRGRRRERLELLPLKTRWVLEGADDSADPGPGFVNCPHRAYSKPARLLYTKLISKTKKTPSDVRGPTLGPAMARACVLGSGTADGLCWGRGIS